MRVGNENEGENIGVLQTKQGSSRLREGEAVRRGLRKHAHETQLEWSRWPTAGTAVIATKLLPGHEIGGG